MPETEGGHQEVAGKLIAAAAQHADKLSKITLRGGMVGRVTWLLIVFCLAAMGMVWSVKDPWITLAGLVSMTVVISFLAPRLIEFAQENPQAALMEGAELLMHEQMKLQMGMKSQPRIDAPPSEDASEPIRHPGIDATGVVDLPDEKSELIEHGDESSTIEGSDRGPSDTDEPPPPSPGDDAGGKAPKRRKG